MRRLALPSGREVILSDTVGFISELPTDLVAAFRATLEEVRAADLIIHVRDISHPETEAQREDVHRVLRELGLESAVETGMVEVLNKIDRLDPDMRDIVVNQARRRPLQAPVSALTGEGCERLLGLIDSALIAARQVVEFAVPVSDGAAIAWLYSHGDVVARRDDGSRAYLTVRLDASDRAKFEHRRRLAAAAND
jgi:GTP-binding protein HflX